LTGQEFLHLTPVGTPVRQGGLRQLLAPAQPLCLPHAAFGAVFPPQLLLDRDALRLGPAGGVEDGDLQFPVSLPLPAIGAVVIADAVVDVAGLADVDNRPALSRIGAAKDSVHALGFAQATHLFPGTLKVPATEFHLSHLLRSAACCRYNGGRGLNCGLRYTKLSAMLGSQQ
jgi:hypothetical protein